MLRAQDTRSLERDLLRATFWARGRCMHIGAARALVASRADAWRAYAGDSMHQRDDELDSDSELGMKDLF